MHTCTHSFMPHQSQIFGSLGSKASNDYLNMEGTATIIYHFLQIQKVYKYFS